MVKHTQTICRLLLDNFSRAFVVFIYLKGLELHVSQLYIYIYIYIYKLIFFVNKLINKLINFLYISY